MAQGVQFRQCETFHASLLVTACRKPFLPPTPERRLHSPSLPLFLGIFVDERKLGGKEGKEVMGRSVRVRPHLRLSVCLPVCQIATPQSEE